MNDNFLHLQIAFFVRYIKTTLYDLKKSIRCMQSSFIIELLLQHAY